MQRIRCSSLGIDYVMIKGLAMISYLKFYFFCTCRYFFAEMTLCNVREANIYELICNPEKN